MKKTGIFMPIRLQSERLPNKMLLPLGDSNLINIACRKLNNISKNTEYNCYVLVSKNDIEAINIVIKYSNINIIYRDNNTCLVDGPLSYIFNDMKYADDTHLMFLNGCLYNLSEDTIIKSIIKFNNSNAEYATSVKKLQNWLFNVDSTSINKIDYEKLNTKLIDPVYQAAHCFHIFNKELFFKNGKMLDNNLLTIEINDTETLDIDTKEDYEYAKYFLSKRYVFDLDGVIAITDNSDYINSKPIKAHIDVINKLYDAGNEIIIQTGRAFISKDPDVERLTRLQLDMWKIKYHSLYFGKSNADIYIDDKAINSYDYFYGDIND